MGQMSRVGCGAFREIGCVVILAGSTALLAQEGHPAAGLARAEVSTSPEVSSGIATLADAPGAVPADSSSASETSSDGGGAGRHGQAGPGRGAPSEHVPEMNLTIGATAQLTATRTANQYGSQFIQGTTPTLGLLAGFHHQIKPLEGYNVNFGYTRLTENYQRNNGITNPATGVTSGTYTRGSVPTDVYEVSGMYVVKRPQVGRQYQPFAEAGGGAVIFAPTTTPFRGHTSVRAAFVFGGGVEYRIGYHLGVRAEYRGLMYKYPDFGDVTTQVPVSKFFTVTSEPAVSLMYRFGRHGGMQ